MVDNPLQSGRLSHVMFVFVGLEPSPIFGMGKVTHYKYGIQMIAWASGSCPMGNRSNGSTNMSRGSWASIPVTHDPLTHDYVTQVSRTIFHYFWYFS